MKIFFIFIITIIFIANNTFAAQNSISFHWNDETLNGKIAFVMGALIQIEEFCLFQAEIDRREGKNYDKSLKNCLNSNFPTHITEMDIVREMDKLFARPELYNHPDAEIYQQAFDALMARKPKK